MGKVSIETFVECKHVKKSKFDASNWTDADDCNAVIMCSIRSSGMPMLKTYTCVNLGYEILLFV
jgi:hypothetical protein